MAAKRKSAKKPAKASPKIRKNLWAYDAQRAHIIAALDGLNKGFVWRDTTEGAEYWSVVFEKLQEMVIELDKRH